MRYRIHAHSRQGLECAVETGCRHLQRNPSRPFHPLFSYFEPWCQDERRHGDFLAAALKVNNAILLAIAMGYTLFDQRLARCRHVACTR
jgi:hypothetical protein